MEKIPPEVICQNCDFYEKFDEKGGCCHRHPPVSHDEISHDENYSCTIYIMEFNYTKEDNWCGEIKIDGVKYFD